MSHARRQDLDWLVTDFTMRVVDVAHAVVVSADGVPLAVSEDIPEVYGEQLAAITAGLVSLMEGAARIFEAGAPAQALVEMEGGLMLLKSISGGSSLAVLAARDCDTDLVSYEMSLLVEAVGEVLTPAVRAQGLLASGTQGLLASRISHLPSAATPVWLRGWRHGHHAAREDPVGPGLLRCP